MIDNDRENLGIRRRSCPGTTLPTTYLTFTELGSGRDLQGVRTNINLHCIEIFSTYREVNTPHLGPKTNNLMLYWDTIDFGSEIHKIRYKSYVGKIQDCLTFRHHASYIQDRRTATPHSTLFHIFSQQIYLITFLDFLSPSSFIPPQNVVYFLMLHFSAHKIFTFYINGVLNCKCPAPGPKG